MKKWNWGCFGLRLRLRKEAWGFFFFPILDMHQILSARKRADWQPWQCKNKRKLICNCKQNIKYHFVLFLLETINILNRLFLSPEWKKKKKKRKEKKRNKQRKNSEHACPWKGHYHPMWIDLLQLFPSYPLFFRSIFSGFVGRRWSQVVERHTFRVFFFGGGSSFCSRFPILFFFYTRDRWENLDIRDIWDASSDMEARSVVIEWWLCQERKKERKKERKW